MDTRRPVVVAPAARDDRAAGALVGTRPHRRARSRPVRVSARSRPASPPSEYARSRPSNGRPSCTSPSSRCTRSRATTRMSPRSTRRSRLTSCTTHDALVSVMIVGDEAERHRPRHRCLGRPRVSGRGQQRSRVRGVQRRDRPVVRRRPPSGPSSHSSTSSRRTEFVTVQNQRPTCAAELVESSPGVGECELGDECPVAALEARLLRLPRRALQHPRRLVDALAAVSRPRPARSGPCSRSTAPRPSSAAGTRRRTT